MQYLIKYSCFAITMFQIFYVYDKLRYKYINKTRNCIQNKYAINRCKLHIFFLKAIMFFPLTYHSVHKSKKQNHGLF